MRRYVALRLAWTVVAAFLVLSATFFLFAFTPDPNEALVEFGAGYQAALAGENATEAAQEAVAAYREARNRNLPILDRYVGWMVDYATLDWGPSHSHGEPVLSVIAEYGKVTLVYLVPALLLSVLGGVGIGLYSAVNRRTPLDYLVRTFAYVGMGIPNFWLAEVLVVLLISQFGWYGAAWDGRYGAFATTNLATLAIPGVVLVTSLLAVQARYARAESSEFVSAEFVKTLRASGAGRLQVARHVLRNASLPLLSLFVSEVVATLFIAVFVVETVLEIPGYGYMAFQALEARDVGLILGTTMIPLLVGILGNLAQDVAYTALDPRVDYEDDRF